MADQEQDLYTFILERFLWQFYSRSWDRQANISRILTQTADILAGETITVENTPQDKFFYAEAKTVAMEAANKFPWLNNSNHTEIKRIFENIEAKLTELVITKSQNIELNVPNY